MYTLKSIAEKLNVSIATISLALNHSPKVNSKTAKRIRELANELDYRPSNIGKALQSKHSQLIGCLVNSVLHSFFNELLEGMGHKAAQEQYGLLTGWSNGSDVMIHVDQMLTQRVDGVVLVGYNKAFEQAARRLRNAGVEFIFCSTHNHGNDPYVVTDDMLGGKLSARYILGCGHRSLLIQDYSARFRLQGCREELREFGDVLYTLFSSPSELLPAIRKTNATAIIFFSDLDALDGMYVLRSHGIRIPEDVSVIGYDNLPITERPEFALTTIGQQRQELGARAVEYLIAKSRNLEMPGNILLPPSLVERTSVARI